MVDEIRDEEGRGVGKEKLLEIIKRRWSGEGSPSQVATALFPEEGDKSLITENHAQMIIPKIRMRILEAARDRKRKKSLITVFLEAFNDEMISFERKGRLEYLGALQALAEAEEAKKAKL